MTTTQTTETRVYILTKGAYSDKHNIGAYSSREGAQERIEAAMRFDEYGDRDDYTIEEFILDESLDIIRAGGWMWEVDIARNGTIISIERSSNDTMLWDWNEWLGMVQAQGYIRTSRDGYVYMQMWARDEEHARKIAGERRTQLAALFPFAEQWR